MGRNHTTPAFFRISEHSHQQAFQLMPGTCSFLSSASQLTTGVETRRQARILFIFDMHKTFLETFVDASGRRSICYTVVVLQMYHAAGACIAEREMHNFCCTLVWSHLLAACIAWTEATLFRKARMRGKMWGELARLFCQKGSILKRN